MSVYQNEKYRAARDKHDLKKKILNAKKKLDQYMDEWRAKYGEFELRVEPKSVLLRKEG